MLRTILENQRVILEALRDGTDTEWITSEIDKRIESTSDELSKLHQPTVSGRSEQLFCSECGGAMYWNNLYEKTECINCGGDLAK